MYYPGYPYYGNDNGSNWSLDYYNYYILYLLL